MSKVLRCVASKDGGVERFVEFHRVVAFSGLSGRRILIRLYNAIKRKKPDGPEVIYLLRHNNKHKFISEFYFYNHFKSLLLISLDLFAFWFLSLLSLKVF